jgi:hypothetical protein
MSTGNGLTRVTVNLTRRAHDKLLDLTGRTGMGKTDVVNKSLQVYALVEDLLDRGGGSLHIQHRDGTEETIHIL